ncbi:MAG: cytochrome c oxidase assembly protein [Planctomycetota bacterium]
MSDSTTAPVSDHHSRNKWMLIGLLAVVPLMWFVGVPILASVYTLVCDALGLGKNPQNAPQIVAAIEERDRQRSSGTAADASAADERSIKVYFQGRALDDLPVAFAPAEKIQQAVIGEDVHNVYTFKNLSDEPVHFRPIHTVTPSFAATSYSMKVCFCFNDQTIEPGGEKTFDVVYRFNPDLDERVPFATVRYDLHRIAEEDMRTGHPQPGEAKPE